MMSLRDDLPSPAEVVREAADIARLRAHLHREREQAARFKQLRAEARYHP